MAHSGTSRYRGEKRVERDRKLRRMMVCNHMKEGWGDPFQGRSRGRPLMARSIARRKVGERKGGGEHRVIEIGKDPVQRVRGRLEGYHDDASSGCRARR